MRRIPARKLIPGDVITNDERPPNHLTVVFVVSEPSDTERMTVITDDGKRSNVGRDDLVEIVKKVRKPKPRTAVVRATGKTVTLAERVATGLVPCTGEVHTNAFIDGGCGTCKDGPWGEMMTYAPLFPAVCQEGYAVPVSFADYDLFEKARKEGLITMVGVQDKNTSYNVYVSTGCTVHEDCRANLELARACLEGSKTS